MARMGRAAVTDTLRDRIVNGLHVGRLKGGDRLPSTRDLATEFDVNERVVLAALRSLADEGFVVLRPRSGAFVGPLHPAGGGHLPHLGVWLVSMLMQARARGLAPRDLPDHLRRSLRSHRVRAACIECNADQLHLLCSELASDHGFVTRSVEADDLERPEHETALRRADLLVTTSYHAAEVQAAAQRLGKPWIVVTLRPEVMEHVAAALEEGPLYYVATDPRFEAKLRRMFTSPAAARNLRVLLVARDDLDSIPADAPCFIMTSARAEVEKRYGVRGGLGRAIHPPRSFSDESARALLTFLVEANAGATLDA
jgi:hypothetical protein